VSSASVSRSAPQAGTSCGCFGEGLKLAGIGVTVGVAVALPLTRLVRSFLFGVTALDPVTFLAVSLGLVLVAATACYIPARRAIKVDRRRHCGSTSPAPGVSELYGASAFSASLRKVRRISSAFRPP